jgi:hypothetical protein
MARANGLQSTIRHSRSVLEDAFPASINHHERMKNLPNDSKRCSISPVPTGNTFSHADRHQNYKENERRWIKGSFLQAVRTHIKSEYGSTLPKWRIWVSMNLENDGTAIWLEHKFDAPESGRWESENVFSIPLREKDVSSSTSPGMIVFECTPLGHVSDELER